MANEIKQLDAQDMTPDRAMEIVKRIQGPAGIEAARKEMDKQIENRKTMIVKLTAQIESYQAFSRTLAALENVWGLTTPNGKMMPDITAGAEPEAVAGEDITKQIKDEQAKRLTEGKCAFKSPSTEGGKWCERMLKSKDEKKLGYCSIHAHMLELACDEELLAEQVESVKKVKRKK
jgi:hypothetical protein